MKNDELMDAWNDINTEFIEEADHLRRNGKKNAGRKRLVTLLAAAAVLTLAIGTAAVMIIRSSTRSGNPAADSGSAVSSGETRETVTAISEEPSEDLSTVTAAAVSDTTEAEEGWWEAEGVYIKCYRNELVEIDNQGPTVMLQLSNESLGVLSGLTTGDRILVRISGEILESWPGSCGPCEVEALSQGSYNDILPTIEQLNEAGWKVIYDGDLNEAVTVQERVEQLLDELNAKYADEGFSINLDDRPVGDDWWEELSMMSVDALREYLEKFYTDEQYRVQQLSQIAEESGDTTELPLYRYTGDDPLLGAVTEYFIDEYRTELETQAAEDLKGINYVALPAYMIFKTKDLDDGRIAVYGSFWNFVYRLEMTTLVPCNLAPCGEFPGACVVTLRSDHAEGGGWVVDEVDRNDGMGSDYATDIYRFAEGDDELLNMYFSILSADENGLSQVQLALEQAIREYVIVNNLPIDSYQWRAGMNEPPIMLYGAGTDELEEAAKAAEEARAAAELEASQNEAEQEASRNEEESDSVPPITEIASHTMSSLAARLKGCTREELRAAWGEPLESLEWNPDYPVDIWRIGEGADQLSVDVQYDKDGNVINGYTYLAADQPTIW